MFSRRCCPILTMVISVILLSGVQAPAQEDYPNRPMEVIVPYGPGGPNDLSLRFLAGKWAEFLGQPVVVVNKPGAAGVLGSKYAANAKPDGYTLLGTSDSAIVWSRMERKDPGYDLGSFRFLYFFGKSIVFFSVKSDSRWKTFNDFLKEAKQNPGKLKYASVGPGSVYNMAVDMMCKAAGGVKLTHIPFKSSPESLAAVTGGNADLAVTFALSGLGRSGLIRTLAVTGEKRVQNFPGIPTLKEMGYPIKYEASEHGLAAPGKTPEKIVAKWIDAHNKVRGKYGKEIEEKFVNMDVYPIYEDGKAAVEIFKEKEKLVKEFHAQIGFKPE